MRLDENLADLLEREEALHEDLAPHVIDKGEGHMVLSHPLLIDAMFIPNGKHALHNKRYLYRKEAVDEAEQAEDWGAVIFLHERPYRFEALWDAVMWNEFNHDPEFWSVVGHVWRDSENIWQNYHQWLEMWHSDAENRSKAMEEDDLEFLDALPDEITIWRGAKKDRAFDHLGYPFGLSWTTDRDKGEWFAKRYLWQGTGVLLRASVSKEKVIAAFKGRGESEIIVDPLELSGIVTEVVYDVP